jgi:hypothetical protein
MQTINAIQRPGSGALWFWLAGIAAGYLLLTGWVYPFFVDDAYIFMRYVDNFSRHQGLVYNPGENVLGVSSFSYLLILAGLKKCLPFLGTAFLVQFLNLVATLGFFALLYRLLNPGRPLFWAALILFSTYFPFIDAHVNGMETSLMLLGLAACFWAIRENRWTWALVLANLTALTRPEGVLLLGLVFLLVCFQLQGRALLRAVLMCGLLTAVLLGIIELSYGTIVPHSMLAKSALISGHSWQNPYTNSLGKSLLLAWGISDPAFCQLPRLVRWGAYAAFCPALLFFGYGLFKGRKTLWIPVAGLFYLLVFAFYQIGQPVRIWSWYTMPTALCFFLVCFHGMEEILMRFHWGRPAAAIRLVVVIVCLASVATTLPKRVTFLGYFNGDLKHLALTIQRRFPLARSVMLGDIGMVGYVSRLRIIDLAGLVSPATLTVQNSGQPRLRNLNAVTTPDIICLRTDPWKNDCIYESGMRYECSRPEDRQFLRDLYQPMGLGSSEYPIVLIKKQMLGKD